jgi:parallel beta-helix repeat protein
MRRLPAIAIGVCLVILCATVVSILGVRTDAQPVPSALPRPTHTTYFVDCGAARDGTGSRAHPWNTVDRVTHHPAFGPGDRILLARGSTCSGRIVPRGSGTPGNPIVLGAYGDGGAPVLVGGGTPDLTGAVQLTDVHDWTVQDLRVTNRPPAGPDGAYRAGVLVLNAAGGRLSGITLQRLAVSDVSSDPGYRDGIDPHEFGGLAVLTRSPDRSAGFDHVRVTGNDVERAGRVGITTWNDSYPNTFDHDVLVSDNTVRWALGDSILMYGADGGTIAGNTSADGGALEACAACRSNPGNTASAGIWPTRSKNIVVDGNEVYGESAEGGDGQGLDVDIETQNITVQRNYVHDNDGGGILICAATSTTIRANVFQDNGSAAFVFNCSKPVSAVQIVNNDVYIGGERPAAVVTTVAGGGATGLVFANNIVFAAAPAGWDWPGAVAASNNTLLGAHSPSEPAGSTLDGVAPLTAMGTGSFGFDSLGGYRPAAGVPEAPSSPIAGPAVDLLGEPFVPAAPGRGAVAPTSGG